jgi:hypothetical protein
MPLRSTISSLLPVHVRELAECADSNLLLKRQEGNSVEVQKADKNSSQPAYVSSNLIAKKEVNFGKSQKHPRFLGSWVVAPNTIY